jgi:hypothetical protein
MPNTSEVQVVRPSNPLVRWVAVAGVIVMVKAIMVGISGLVALVTDEVRLRLGI